MDIDMEGTAREIKKIVSYIDRINTKAAALKKAVGLAGEGFESVNYQKVQSAVSQMTAAMNRMVNNLEAARAYVEAVLDVAEAYLACKY